MDFDFDPIECKRYRAPKLLKRGWILYAFFAMANMIPFGKFIFLLDYCFLLLL